MPTIIESGHTLFYTEHQPEVKGFTLLLIHGAGGSHLVWSQVLRQMQDVHVIALDLPGHGGSDPPGRRLIAHYAASVEMFVGATRLENVILIGHSMGAAIALTMALRSIVNPRGLVLMGASARMLVGEALLDGSLSSIDRAAAYIAAHGFADASPELQEGVRRQLLLNGAVVTFGDFLACNRFDVRSRLQAIDTPTLVIAGTNDQLTPLRFAESLAAGLPEARLVKLVGAGHFSMIERPQEIAVLSSEFIKRLGK